MAIEEIVDCPLIEGRRVLLRPLEAEDFDDWRDVRRRNADWLKAWEPRRGFGQPDPVEDRQAFTMRCAARRRERQLGTGWGFGVFVPRDGVVPGGTPGSVFAGELNLSNVVLGAFRSAHVWEDHLRYAMTAEEWSFRRAELVTGWLESRLPGA